MAEANHSLVQASGRAVVVREASLREILSLRHSELRPGLPRHTAQFAGDDDPTTRHFGAFDAATGEALGCASLMVAPCEGEWAWQLRGMATRGDLLRCGIGAALLRHAEQALAAAGPVLLWCNARTAAVAFYQRQGWAVVSGPFDTPGVGEHHPMKKRLAAQVL